MTAPQRTTGSDPAEAAEATAEAADAADAAARLDLADLVNTYADALDRRDWSALDAVFAPEVSADYNGRHLAGV
ncbi:MULTISPECIES: nuclear transport factor 2 family protein [unclassified Streptomyces]|uniref:nuclear transport factor 2 family protein n=1 Tax=unclassified Streptomyces TaxID=2593676 RepID=UPI002E133DDE|nr:nuclear transport factor 2 family protein [Streptomyces sp. NBC_01197]WSS51789.1 nuclear transport factor 2 family protein [Streptomyces sp. NBC_01180]